MDPSHSPPTPVVSSDELAKQLKRISDHLSELTTTSTLGGSLNSARARRKPTQKMSSIKSAANPYSRLMLLNEQGVVKDYYRVRSRTVVVVGLGGIGGALAQTLSQSGVGYLRIIDSRKVEADDVSGLFFRPHMVGWRKTEAVTIRFP